ncbi:MAG: aspartyl protease family protein [Chloroflexi bacterium]|nr:aspartyl protease family protein [Chloroflexota bacterium]
MGTFRHPIEIGDPQGQRFERVEVLVDTGASYSVAPVSLLRRLGVTPHDRVTFILANGRRVERDLGRTWVRIDGKSVITLVVFGDEGTDPLLGAYTLEGVRLGVGPYNQRLVPTPGLLMQTKKLGNSGPTMRSRAKLSGV